MPTRWAPSKKAGGQNPHFIFVRLGRPGRSANAQATFAACRSIFPDLTVAWVRDVVPYDKASALDRFVDGLTKASLSDDTARSASA